MKLLRIFSRRDRIIIRELVVTDFKLRYQGSILGYLWSLLKPLLLFTILYLVFVRFLRFGGDVEHFPIYLLLGIVLWTFFTEATNQGLHAIVDKGGILRKIAFPKYVLVLASTISALINLAINLAVVFIFMLVTGAGIQSTLIYLPLNILELYVFALALAFFLSTAMVKYRDIGYIWEVVLQGFFYATPIIYPVSMVLNNSETAAKLLMLNPVAQIIQDARYNMVTHQTITTWSLIDNPFLASVPFLIVLLFITLASIYFRKRARFFAEDI